VHIRKVDLNLFVVFDTIYAEGGITRASGKLHLTQPALSHALGRLRELFGDPLFVRQGRAMVPTPFARNLIDPVRRSLRDLEITLHGIERFDPATTTKQFTLGVRDVLEAALLPPLMQQLARSAPGADVNALNVDRRELAGELASGRLDAALDVLLPLPENIRRKRVLHDGMVVLARKQHPAVKRRLTLDTYLKQGHILVSSRPTGPGLEDVELSRHGLERRVRLRCQHYFAACRVVQDTDLLLTMPERYAQIANRSFQHRMLPFPLEGPTLDGYLYWHANIENEPANRWLREQLVAALKESEIR
jgi:DNA-binding transcriptional LysR family regulator